MRLILWVFLINFRVCNLICAINLLSHLNPKLGVPHSAGELNQHQNTNQEDNTARCDDNRELRVVADTARLLPCI